MHHAREYLSGYKPGHIAQHAYSLITTQFKAVNLTSFFLARIHGPYSDHDLHTLSRRF
jgi:hypothetical protein